MIKNLRIISLASLFFGIAHAASADTDRAVFITSASYKADLGGLKGADAKCQAEANDAESIVPEGTYPAWLLDDSEGSHSRFARSSEPYALPDGTKITQI